VQVLARLREIAVDGAIAEQAGSIKRELGCACLTS